MSDVLLEVIQPSGARHHVPLGDTFITLGRGYDRDIIVADDFLSASHLRFRVTDEGVEVTEEGSENGTRVEIDGEGRQPLEGTRCLPVGSRLIAGNTLIVLRHRHEPVPPARALRTQAHGGGDWRDRHAWWILLPMLLALAWGAAWLQRDQRDEWNTGIALMTSVALVVTLWSGLWALVGKLAVHRAHYLNHLGLASLGGVVVFLLDYLREVFLFAVEVANPSPWSLYAHQSVVFSVLLLGVLFSLLFAHLGVATLMRRTGRTLVALSMPGVLGALMLVEHSLDVTQPREQSAVGEWMLPADWRWAPVSSQEDFISGLASLERRANLEAARSPEWRLDFPGEGFNARSASKD